MLSGYLGTLVSRYDSVVPPSQVAVRTEPVAQRCLPASLSPPVSPWKASPSLLPDHSPRPQPCWTHQCHHLSVLGRHSAPENLQVRSVHRPRFTLCHIRKPVKQLSWLHRLVNAGSRPTFESTLDTRPGYLRADYNPPDPVKPSNGLSICKHDGREGEGCL